MRRVNAMPRSTSAYVHNEKTADKNAASRSLVMVNCTIKHLLGEPVLLIALTAFVTAKCVKGPLSIC